MLWLKNKKRASRLEKMLAYVRERLRFWRWHLAALMHTRPGVGPPDQQSEIIVSLTTTPARLRKVHLAVESLLQQGFRPSRVILWVSDELAAQPLPFALRRQQRRGLEVRYRRDLRSFTKLIHTLREYPDAIIVTADDDTFYPRDWLLQLRESYLRHPACIHCHRAHLMLETAAGALRPYMEWEFFSPGQTGPSFSLFPTGVGGVLYPPKVLPPEILNETLFLKLCPAADDVWFKAMALLAGVPTVKVAPAFSEFPTVPGTQGRRLYSFNSAEGNNDRQLQAVFQHYDLLPMSKLRPCFQPSAPLFICGQQPNVPDTHHRADRQ